MPGQRRAFHSHRVFAHAGEYRKLPQSIGFGGNAGPGRDQSMESIEIILDFVERLALDEIGHQGRRSLGDRAAATLKGHLFDTTLIIHPCVEGEFVSAQGVVTVRLVVRVGEHPKVAGLLVVAQDRILLELA